MIIPKILRRVENELSCHVDLIALGIIASSFSVYLYYASGYYLNPDEASHFVFANQGSLWKAFNASHNLAHPPLMIMVLHLFLGLGKAVFMMRLLSAVFCSLAAWLAFKWIQRVYGSTIAITGLILFSFSPAMISAATEVRQYALLLFFICGALYFLQRFLDERSLRLGFFYSVFVYGAILTHYSAIWVALTFAIYGTFLFFRKNPGWRINLIWCISQTGVLILYVFLYFTHIRWMLNSGFAKDQIHGYLKSGYFSPGQETLLTFIFKNTLDFFTYLAGGERAGIIALACFLMGIFYIFYKHAKNRQYEGEIFHEFFLLLPFIMALSGAIIQLMPFGGSRHSIYLLPFAITPIALCVVNIFSVKRFSLIAVAALILLPLWLHNWYPPNANPAMSGMHMQAALKKLHERVSAQELIFVDDMTHYVLAYYMGNDQSLDKIVHRKNVDEFRMGRYHMVAARTFAFSPSNFDHELIAMSRQYNFKSGESVWGITVGWGNANVFGDYISTYPPERLKECFKFGPITLFRVSVPPAV